ncbi:hypothetical protein D3C86_1804410 [compost metagenome]
MAKPADNGADDGGGAVPDGNIFLDVRSFVKTKLFHSRGDVIGDQLHKSICKYRDSSGSEQHLVKIRILCDMFKNMK